MRSGSSGRTVRRGIALLAGEATLFGLGRWDPGGVRAPCRTEVQASGGRGAVSRAPEVFWASVFRDLCFPWSFRGMWAVNYWL